MSHEELLALPVGGGADTIIGGSGEDILYGGSGGDTFLYQQASDGGDFKYSMISGLMPRSFSNRKVLRDLPHRGL